MIWQNFYLTIRLSTRLDKFLRLQELTNNENDEIETTSLASEGQ